MEAAKKAKHECVDCKQVFDRAERLTIHIQRGCNHTTCTTCCRKFSRHRDLLRHRKNADAKVCDVCSKTFCHQSELQRHKRTAHIGYGIPAKANDPQLDQPICPRTGLEDDEGYKEEARKHSIQIRDSQSESKYLMDIKKELTPDFTYRDLQTFIRRLSTKTNGRAFKINLGFGFMLRHVVTDEFRYYYPSSNNLLFERAFTVSDTSDITRLMKRVLDLDLVNNYYMKRPSSGWTVAGLTNLYVQIMYLSVVLD